MSSMAAWHSFSWNFLATPSRCLVTCQFHQISYYNLPEYCTKVEEIQLWDLDQAKKIPAHPSSHSSRKHPKTRLIVVRENSGNSQLSAVTMIVQASPFRHPFYRSCVIPAKSSFMFTLDRTTKHPSDKLANIHLILMFSYNLVTFICNLIVACLMRKRARQIQEGKSTNDFKVYMSCIFRAFLL